jgi:hypothetical protein
VIGLKLTNIKDETSASLVNHKDDISFMIDCMNLWSDDIVIQKGLRINHQAAELIIQKPGQADSGCGKIVFFYGTDLTNLAYRLSTLENGSGSGSGSGEGEGEGEGVSPEYIIDEITATNRYVGVDQCYNLFTSHEPIFLFYVSFFY